MKVQVLTQCREELIDRTFESIEDVGSEALGEFGVLEEFHGLCCSSGGHGAEVGNVAEEVGEGDFGFDDALSVFLFHSFDLSAAGVVLELHRGVQMVVECSGTQFQRKCLALLRYFLYAYVCLQRVAAALRALHDAGVYPPTLHG